MNILVQFRYALIVGLQEFTYMWNWKTWFGGWIVMIIAQSAFFSLFARLFGSPQHEHFLLIGNAVAVGAHTASWAIFASTWDRRAGTYPLLVIAPASLIPVIVGRSAVWMASGVATSVITFAVLGAIFDFSLPWPNALLLIPFSILTCASTFAFSLSIGSMAIRQPQLGTTLSGILTIFSRAFCGVSVPLTFWPDSVQFVVRLLPITNGLQAIRLALDEASLSSVLQAAALEVAVTLGWIILAVFLIDRVANAGRKDGSIEFVQ